MTNGENVKNLSNATANPGKPLISTAWQNTMMSQVIDHYATRDSV